MHGDWFGYAATFVTTIVTVGGPLVGYISRLTSKLTSMETKLTRVVEDVASLMRDKEQRLRWLENNLYDEVKKHGR